MHASQADLKGELTAEVYVFVTWDPKLCSNCMTGPRHLAQVANITYVRLRSTLALFLCSFQTSASITQLHLCRL